MLELLKIIVQPVVLERDEDGNVVGEKVGDPTPLYRIDQVVEFVEALQAQIAKENRNVILPSEDIVRPTKDLPSSP